MDNWYDCFEFLITFWQLNKNRSNQGQIYTYMFTIILITWVIIYYISNIICVTKVFYFNSSSFLINISNNQESLIITYEIIFSFSMETRFQKTFVGLYYNKQLSILLFQILVLMKKPFYNESPSSLLKFLRQYTDTPIPYIIVAMPKSCPVSHFNKSFFQKSWRLDLFWTPL